MMHLVLRELGQVSPKSTHPQVNWVRSTQPGYLPHHLRSWYSVRLFSFTVYKRVDIWFHTVFRMVNCLSIERYKLI